MKCKFMLLFILFFTLGCAGGSVTVPLDNLIPLLLLQNPEQPSQPEYPLIQDSLDPLLSFEQNKCLKYLPHPHKSFPEKMTSYPQNMIIASLDKL